MRYHDEVNFKKEESSWTYGPMGLETMMAEWGHGDRWLEQQVRTLTLTHKREAEGTLEMV